MSTQVDSTPSSAGLPGVGNRRKGPKAAPRLPMSAFSPPNSGTGEKFPLPPSPSTVHPQSVVDAHVVAATGDLSQWKQEAGEILGSKVGGVVLSLQTPSDSEVESTVAGLSSSVPIISALVPFNLDVAPPAQVPSYLSGSAKLPISLSTTYAKPGPGSAEALKWGLQNARAVDIDVRVNLTESKATFEGFEELLTTATKVEEGEKTAPIILSNVVPPPSDLTLPIVKLMNHPTYHAYQANIAALSLFPNLHVKFLPPTWDAPTPPTPEPKASFDMGESKEKKEWKRRIKMYVGPVLEAFGYERIIFGSSHSSASTASSNAADWYEIARESFAELGVEQEAIDAVFSNNAKRVYGAS